MTREELLKQYKNSLKEGQGLCYDNETKWLFFSDGKFSIMYSQYHYGSRPDQEISLSEAQALLDKIVNETLSKWESNKEIEDFFNS